jgi:DNA polymerase I-like protein with 3'-5' exonuclease and polymerase domains
MVRAPKVTKPRKLKKKVETYEDFEYEDLCTYAGIDTNVTLDLLKALFPYLTHKPEYRDFIEGAEISTRAPDILTELLEVKTLGLEFTCDLKVTGMFYDQEANAIMRQQMVEDMKETKERIDDYAGMDVPMSGGAFYNYLYRVRKYKSVVKTKNGDEATSGDALKALAKEYPDDKDFLLDLKRFVDVRSMFNGFVDGYIEKFVKYDSRIHCDYLLHGTSSHRMSSQNPNMLNMISVSSWSNPCRITH